MGLATKSGIKLEFSPEEIARSSLSTFLKEGTDTDFKKTISEKLSGGLLVASSLAARVYFLNGKFFTVLALGRDVHLSEPGIVNSADSSIAFKLSNGSYIFSRIDMEKKRISISNQAIRRSFDLLSFRDGGSEVLSNSKFNPLEKELEVAKKTSKIIARLETERGFVRLYQVEKPDAESRRLHFRLKANIDGQHLSVFGIKDRSKKGIPRIVFRTWNETDSGYKYEFLGSCSFFPGTLKAIIRFNAESVELEIDPSESVVKFFEENFGSSLKNEREAVQDSSPIEDEEDFTEEDLIFLQSLEDGSDGDDSSDEELTEADLRFLRGELSLRGR